MKQPLTLEYLEKIFPYHEATNHQFTDDDLKAIQRKLEEYNINPEITPIENHMSLYDSLRNFKITNYMDDYEGVIDIVDVEMIIDKLINAINNNQDKVDPKEMLFETDVTVLESGLIIEMRE